MGNKSSSRWPSGYRRKAIVGEVAEIEGRTCPKCGRGVRKLFEREPALSTGPGCKACLGIAYPSQLVGARQREEQKRLAQELKAQHAPLQRRHALVDLLLKRTQDVMHARKRRRQDASLYELVFVVLGTTKSELECGNQKLFEQILGFDLDPETVLNDLCFDAFQVHALWSSLMVDLTKGLANGSRLTSAETINLAAVCLQAWEIERAQRKEIELLSKQLSAKPSEG